MTSSLTTSTALSSTTFTVATLIRPRPAEYSLTAYCAPSPGTDSYVYCLMQGLQNPEGKASLVQLDRQGNGGSERLSNLPKVTQRVQGRA